MNRFAHPRTQMRALLGARLVLAASLLALLAALVFAAGQQSASAGPADRLEAPATALLPAGQQPNFVVIQTDDQTLDQLYATFTPPGGAPITAMPNTLALIAGKGDHLQPLLRLLPALLPLAGQPADRPLRPQPQRPRQRAAQRRLHRLLLPPGLQPQPRHLAAGRRLPHDPHRQVPQRLRRRTVRQRHRPCRPAGTPGTRVLKADTDHYFYGYTLNNNGGLEGPDRRLRQLGDARIRRPRRLRLPVRAAQRPALPLRDRRLHPDRQRRDAGDAGRPALLPAARLHRPARRLPPPGRAGAGDPPLRLLRRRPLPARPLGRLQRGQRQRQAALHPRSLLPLADRDPHLPRLLPEGAGVAALDRRRRQTGRRHARRDAPAAQHLHHLHLRQRLLLRRAPAHRRQVPRLRALDPPAVPDPRAGDQARRPRPASWRPTSTSPRRSSSWPAPKPTKASTAARWSPT